jgi:hypothetical protein
MRAVRRDIGGGAGSLEFSCSDPGSGRLRSYEHQSTGTKIFAGARENAIFPLQPQSEGGDLNSRRA